MNFIVPVCAIWVMGAALLVYGAGRAGYTFSLPEFAGMSFLTGSVLAVFLLFFYSFMGVRFEVTNLIAIPALFFIMLSSRYMAKPYRVGDILSREASSSEWGLAEKLFFCGIVMQILWVFLRTLPAPVHSHDAVANYALKAKIFFFSSGIPSGFFGWREATVAHPDYPVFLPLVMTWVYAFTGFNDVTVRLIMPLFYTGFIMVFFSLMKKLFNPAYAILAAFFLATIPQMTDYATIIHADLVLTAFVTIGLLYFVSYTRSHSGFDLMLSSFMMASSLWIKNEAIVFAGVFAAAVGVFILRSQADARRKALSQASGALALMAAISLPWFLVKLNSAAANSDLDLMSLTFSRVLENVKEIPALLDLFQQEVFGPKKWNIFWIIFFGSLIWKRKKTCGNEVFYLRFFMCFSAAAYFTGYMLMTGENLYFYVNTTISRFMLHFSGAAAALMGFLLFDDVESSRRGRRE